MNNKNKQNHNRHRYQRQRHDGCNYGHTPITEVMDIHIDSIPVIQVSPTEYRAMIEAQTRIQVASDYINSTEYAREETLAVIMGVLPRGANADT